MHCNLRPHDATFAVYRLWRGNTLYQIWTQSSNPRRSYCAFHNDLKHCVMCCARLWDKFHQVWPSTTYTCLNYSVCWCWYVMSRCDLDLWPLNPELLQHFGCHMFKRSTKFERNRIIQLIVKLYLYDRTSGIHFGGDPLRGCWERCIVLKNTKKIRKFSSIYKGFPIYLSDGLK